MTTMENNHPIWKFVDPNAIDASMGPMKLEAEERETAIDSVRTYRAQWVVDNIAAELGERAIELRTREADLAHELKGVRKELAVINSALGLEFKKPSLEEERKEKYMGIVDRHELLEYVADERPFSLTLSAHKDNNVATLWPWFKAHQTEIVSLYGMKIYDAANRFLSDFVHNYHSIDSFDYLKNAGAVEDIALVEQPDKEYDALVLTNCDPVKFFTEILRIPFVGTRKTLALLCMIDMQRAEQASTAQQLTTQQ